MEYSKGFTVFRWTLLSLVSLSSLITAVIYLRENNLPIVIFNCCVPFILLFIFRKDVYNRVGWFLLSCPLIFLVEVLQIRYRGDIFPKHLGLDTLAVIYTLNLILISLFSRHFTGKLHEYIDILVYPFLGTVVLTYVLIYCYYPFDPLPYAILLAVMTVFYRITSSQIKAHERQITEQRQTILNTRLMIRSVIHDLANFISAAQGWTKMAMRSNDELKKADCCTKAFNSFSHAISHTKNVSSILCDQQQLVVLSQISADIFCREVFHCVTDSFVGKVVITASPSVELSPDILYFHYPDTLGNKQIYADLRTFCGAVVNLISNAKKAGATGININISEKSDETGLELQVLDNGSGIPPDKISSLFREKIDSVNGAGVGLLGVRMILQCHKANITCVNPNSDGTGQTEFLISTLEYLS